MSEPTHSEKRRSQRILLRVPVVVTGRDHANREFEEETHTLVVNAHGALVELNAEVAENQPVKLRNRTGGREEECRVVWYRKSSGEASHVGLEFSVPSPHFWPVEFPPEDWGASQTMKAAVLKGLGRPFELADVPKPAKGQDEVLVQVEACGVCHSDLHLARGEWPDVARKMTWPAILGHEAVGRVVELGVEVRQVKIGQRVGVGWLYSTCGACEFCRSGAENVCLERKVTGIAAPGGYAEFLRVKASHAIPVPENLSPQQAAPLFCAGLTVFHACRNAGLRAGEPCGLAPGKRVAVFGVGGLGHLALQLARLGGAETVAVDVSEAKLSFARKLGAAQTINALSADAAGLLKADGGPHMAVVTTPSKAAYDLAFRTLRRRGTLAVVGLPKEDLTFFADDLVVGEFKIVGSAVGTREEMRELLAMAAAGKIHSEVEVCRLDQINEIFSRMQRGELLGRAVIKF